MSVCSPGAFLPTYMLHEHESRAAEFVLDLKDTEEFLAASSQVGAGALRSGPGHGSRLQSDSDPRPAGQCILLDKSYEWFAGPSERIRNRLPPLGLEVCGGQPDLPFAVRARDGFPDFDGSNLLVFVDDVFEFCAEPAFRHGRLRAGSAEAAHGSFEVVFHVRVPAMIVRRFYAPAFQRLTASTPFERALLFRFRIVPRSRAQ